MKKIFFGLFDSLDLARQLCTEVQGELAEFTLRHFPDQETYVRVISPVRGKECVIVCSLNDPDQKILPLFYLSRLCKQLQAAKVTLVAPYLSYMRQDKQFNPGEAVTSELFAQFLSGFVDELLTIDPHLHRKHSMAELYNVPCTVLSATGLISSYISQQVSNPLLIGPDSESEQWVSRVAASVKAPYLVLEKLRKGDRDVEVSHLVTDQYSEHTPVLVDDIISTAKTMIATVKHIHEAGLQSPVIIGVHAIFAGIAYEDLKNAIVADIVTCNTITHATNKINVCNLIALNLK